MDLTNYGLSDIVSDITDILSTSSISSTNGSTILTPTSPLNNSYDSSSYSFPSSPPANGLMTRFNSNFNSNNNHFTSDPSSLTLEDTLKCLQWVQDEQIRSKSNQWDTAEGGQNARIAAVLQEHLLAHLLGQQSPKISTTTATHSNITTNGHFSPTYSSFNLPCTNNNISGNANSNGINKVQGIPWTTNTSRDQNAIRLRRRNLDNVGKPNEPRHIRWEGDLPARSNKNPIYSCKVFLGGVPFEATIESLTSIFRVYGNVKVDWPGKTDPQGNPHGNPQGNPKGYAYLVYESEKNVKQLLQHCIFKHGSPGDTEKGWFFNIPTNNRKTRHYTKQVQVIPWDTTNDAEYKSSPYIKLEPQWTVFVGGLHGMINARGLAMIMDNLFGGVIYAGTDTCKLKYPLGSARVAFDNNKSYTDAITAAYVKICAKKINKIVQVDPYLEDASCSECKFNIGQYFCRSFSCFRYFCNSCMEKHQRG